MAERLPSGAPTGDASASAGGGVGPGTPRWVKVFVIVASILLVVFVALHLTGHQLGGHMPSGAHRMHTSGAAAQ